MEIPTPLDQLLRDVESSEGRRIETARRPIRSSLWTFDKNYGELRAKVDEFIDPEGAIALLSDRATRDAYLLDVSRLWHNYLASVTSLISSTRWMINDLYLEQEFHDEYDERKRTEFVEDGLTQFVIVVKNLGSHVQPHLPFGKIHLNPSGHDCFVYMSKEELTDAHWHDRANNVAKAFAEEQPDEIRIGEIASAYHAKVMAFYRWLDQRQDALHTIALAELKRLNDCVRSFQSPEAPE